ncbi:conserved hypothetical protein [Thermosinus carboxydivorans Nor1]|uniref:DRTGG domain-containing protein n=1 Tax=Thermosinus carboxydivorans Nor1 TaxID=401526 RepID=A1HP46_9FIRM|nr:DRTGG domain-containing protein [Thermosinus carboxydivorans]EAX48154.1 conserved hypothetical protein [Thermosinus carboxydivorans Nor1]
MKLAQVREILQAEVICGENSLETEAICACGADLMSDVLAFTKEKTLLLTGLTNIQVIRTAEVSDLVGIVFVRGKRPGDDVVRLAQAKGIPLLVCSLPMYEACGLLYISGLAGCSQR